MLKVEISSNENDFYTELNEEHLAVTAFFLQGQ